MVAERSFFVEPNILKSYQYMHKAGSTEALANIRVASLESTEFDVFVLIHYLNEPIT